MKKLISFRLSFAVLSFIFMFSIAAMSQPVQYEPTRCWLTVEDPSILKSPPISNSNYTTISALNTIFRNSGVIRFEQAVPFAKTEELKKLYEVEVSINIDNFITAIQNSPYRTIIKDFSKFKIEDTTTVYQPSDYFWYYDDAAWDLKQMQADLAWDITKGSPDVIIAVIDTDVDITHPDLKSKIKYNYDPYTKRPFGRIAKAHGTIVSGFAAAETSLIENKAMGQALSLGFLTRFIFYNVTTDSQEFLQRALHASTVEKADVVVSCAWGGISSTQGDASYESKFVKEILDNGTVIIAPAGNGITGGGFNMDYATGKYKPFYPFNPCYDSRIITVSGTGPGDKFLYDNGSKSVYLSYFPEVDVCAPGHHLANAYSTFDPVNPYETPYVYFGFNGGTSFSSPITAGLAALIKSIDKTFTPEEIKWIIKNTTDPIVDANKFKDEQGRICTGTGRINAYKAVNLAQIWKNGEFCYPRLLSRWSPEVTITGTETVYGNLTIESGQTLTVKGTLKFSRHSGITVKHGGKLIVDGGVLTSSDDGSWLGVEVWGNKRLSMPKDSERGIAIFKNARIENADIGILNGRRVRDNEIGEFDPADYPEITFDVNNGSKTVPGETVEPLILPYGIYTYYTGGKITADNTDFINNRASVAFYDNNTTGSGTFTRCRFTLNNNLGNYRIKGKAMVHLYSVKGIVFSGCKFESSLTGIIANEKAPTGIYSYNASFTINNVCTHSGGMMHYGECTNRSGYSLFKGLSYGIYATNPGGTMPYNVKRTDFINVCSGIYNGGVNNISVTNCNFEIDKGKNEVRPNYCIYLNNSTGYKIENNTFKTITPTTNSYSDLTYAVVIHQSGETVNRIYNNSFTGFKYAIQASGKNKNTTTGAGLCFTCNDFIGNDIDMNILPSTVIAQENGISNIQKNGNNPASNTFSRFPSWHIYNNCVPIYYWSHKENLPDKKLIPDINNTNKTVTVIKQENYPPYNKQRDCPNSQQGGITPPDIVVKLEDYKNKALLLQTELSEKTDGGNTEELINIINKSDATDTQQLKSVLMENSPYLSDEAVKAGVLNEEAISNAMVRDIIIGNSHTSKNPEVREAVKNRINSMPDYMLSQIESAANNISDKEILTENLQKELINYSDKFNTALNEAVEDNNTQLWESIMDNSITDDIKYDYLMYNILKGDNEKADLVKTFINSQTNEYEFYEKYLDLFSSEIIKGKLTDSVVELLTEIASSDSKSGLMATAILTNFGYMKYIEPFYFNEASDVPIFKNTINNSNPNDKLKETQNLKVYPNPASDYIIVHYNSDLYSENIKFIITDIKGTIIQQIRQTEANDNFKINIKELPKGNYILSLLFEGHQVESVKFTVK